MKFLRTFSFVIAISMVLGAAKAAGPHSELRPDAREAALVAEKLVAGMYVAAQEPTMSSDRKRAHVNVLIAKHGRCEVDLEAPDDAAEKIRTTMASHGCSLQIDRKDVMTNKIQRVPGERLSVVVLGTSEESNAKLLNAALRLPQRFVVIGERSALIETIDASRGKPVECFPTGTEVPTGDDVLVFDEVLIAAWAERARNTAH